MRQPETDVHRSNTDVRWVGFHPLLLRLGNAMFRILILNSNAVCSKRQNKASWNGYTLFKILVECVTISD